MISFFLIKCKILVQKGKNVFMSREFNSRDTFCIHKLKKAGVLPVVQETNKCWTYWGYFSEPRSKKESPCMFFISSFDAQKLLSVTTFSCMFFISSFDQGRVSSLFHLLYFLLSHDSRTMDLLKLLMNIDALR